MNQYKASKPFREQFVTTSLSMAIAVQVRESRTQRGWTQHALAKKAGLSQATITRLELGTTIDCTVATLCKVAAAFECALMIRFISHSEFIEWIFSITCDGVSLVPTFLDEDKAFLEAQP